MKKIFIVFCTLLFQYTLIAQAPEMNFRNLHKYWEYKHRLHDKFVVIDWGGDGMGEFLTDEFRFEKSGYSTPAVSYWPFINSGQQWRLTGEGLGNIQTPIEDELGQQPEENNLSEDRFGILGWGDGTIFLGHYIGVLATEYALLTQNAQTVQATSTLEELYLALQAYRRLDITANRLEEERALRNGITCATELLQFDGYSGWFLREDAHSEIWEEFNDSEINGAVSDFSKRDKNIFHDYDFNNSAIKNQLDDVLPSQDQIVHLLFGLSLARTYIPSNATVRGENLRSMITNIANGLVFGNPDTKFQFGANVHSPVFPCEDRTFQIDGRGTEYWNYVGMLYAHSYITDTPVNISASTGSEKQVWGTQANAFAEFVGDNSNKFPFFIDIIIDFFESKYIGNYGEVDGNINDNLTMYLALTAAGDPAQGSPFGSSSDPSSPIQDDLYTLWEIGELGKYIYPLALYNMHYSDVTNEFYSSQNAMYNRLTILLNSAPCGGGCTPCNKSDDNGGGFCSAEYNQQSDWCQADLTQWHVRNRFVSSPVDYNPTFKGLDKKLPGRRTNGLDYMLAYNLYHLTFTNGMIPYFNTFAPEGDVEIRYADNNNYPSQGMETRSYYDEVEETVDVYDTRFPLHTDSDPLIIISETIESNAVINANALLECYDFELINDVPNFMYCDNNTVTNDPKIIEVAAGVIYKADDIILNDGFRAEEGAVFIAETTVGESVICLPDGTFGRYANEEEIILQEELELTPSTNPSFDNLNDKYQLNSYSFKTYPNPFSNNLTIEYKIPNNENIQISLFNSAGQKIIEVLNKQTKMAGIYQENINSSNLMDGIYFVKIILSDRVITKKVTLIH